MSWAFFIFGLLWSSPTPLGWAEIASSLRSETTNTSNETQGVVAEALEGLKLVVNLWRDRNFDAVYRLGTAESQRQYSTEQFARLMKNGDRQLQCCWATVQDMKGFFESPSQVYVWAKLGYEHYQNKQIGRPDQDTEPAQWVISSSFDPRTFLMVLEEGKWRVDLNEVLMASGHLPESLRRPAEAEQP